MVYFWSPWERLPLYTEIVRRNAIPLVVAVLAISIWEFGVDVLKIEQFLLPKPSVIWDKFKEIYPALIAGSWFTIRNAIEGFVIGCGAGILTGILSARFTHFSKAVLPLAVAANAVPIIAFAPIFNAWFGLTSTDSKVAIVAVLCYFPAMISTVQGLTSIEQRQLELMQSYAASEAQIFRYLRLPTALPFIFSALKLAATLAMIGAIVAEFFGGTPATALGFRIKNDAGLLRMAESWSAIMVASALGIGFFLFISMMERSAMPWYRSFRNDPN
jgi:NitT/TauT family transport system permease protein